MEYIGICNDGVGKSVCGGQIIVCVFVGGGQDYGENVLVGNFVLFGVIGGCCFIQGQVGDCFVVWNLGVMVVVEGVGDFCVEYMMYGVVLNFGGFFKGFGNGMLGGFVY